MRSIWSVLGLLACGPADEPPPLAGGDAGSCPGAAGEVLRLADVQGPGTQSPLRGLEVSVCGVVTAPADDGFFIEALAEDRDSDPRTSEGLRIVSAGHVPESGQWVRITGRVDERAPMPTDRSETVVIAEDIEVLGRVELPPPTPVHEAFASLGTVSDWIAAYERHAGMRVALGQPTVVQGRIDLESVCVAEPRLSPSDRTAAGGVLGRRGLRPDVFLLDGLGEATLGVGDVLDGVVEGVVTYRDGRYRLRSTSPLPPARSAGRPPDGLAAPAGDTLRVGTQNAEWLGAGDSSRIERLAQAIVFRFASPDVVVLQEVLAEAAEQTMARLVDAVAAQGGPAYEAVIDHASARSLRIAMLLRRDRVSLVAPPERDSGSETSSGWGADGLAPNPAPVQPDAPAFFGSRVPLAAHVCVEGRSVLVIGVHFTSRRADDPLMGASQPPRAPSETRRAAQAARVVEFIARAASTEALVVVAGDFNDTPESAPLGAFAEADLVNLAADHPPSRRYSYVYQGTSQLLDHVLVDRRHAGGARVDILHGQADRPAEERDTDHDAVVLTAPLSGVAPCP